MNQKTPEENATTGSNTSSSLQRDAQDDVLKKQLFHASFQGDVEAVRSILSRGVDPSSARNNQGASCLHSASQNGHEAVVRLLINHGADVRAQITQGWRVLHSAAMSDSKAIVHLLVEKGADVSDTLINNDTALHIAARMGKTNTVEALVEKGADIVGKGNMGLTPLHMAARAGKESIVSLLLENGVKDSADEENGRTALFLAAEAGHKAIVRILLDRGSDVFCAARDGSTVLYTAAEGGHVGIVKILLDNDARSIPLVSQDAVDSADGLFRDVRTPLYVAARGGHISVVKILLERGGVDEEQATMALFAAVLAGQEEVVTTLLKWGAMSGVTTGRNTNGLHISARRGDEGILKLLLNSGLKSVADVDGMMPLHFAASRGHESCAEALLEKEPQTIDEVAQGKTALHLAADHGHEGMVRLLLNKGIDYTLLDHDGRTAAFTARREGHENLAELLRAYHAPVQEKNLTARLQARASESKYQHQPLPDGLKYIRLLFLDVTGPDEERLSGTLQTVSLDDSPHYFALSYTWGEPKFDRKLFLNGSVMEITSGLYLAVKRLRKLTPKALWIDQICINQDEIDEKSQQVGIMSKIYSQASSVYIWLGEHDKTTEEGLSMARFVVDSYANTNSNPSKGEVSNFWRHQKPGLSFQKTWASWAKMYSKLWFSRMWVVQEYVLARDHRIFCGDYEIPKKLFLSALLKDKGLGDGVTPIDEVLKEAGALHNIQNLSKMEMLREHRCNTSHALILGIMGGFECREPVDRIFALLGMLPQDPNLPMPDYSLTVSEVYQQFARYLIRSGLGRFNLGFSGLDHADPSLKLPTWCPDWSMGNKKHMLQLSAMVDAPRSVMAQVKLNEKDPQLITVDGCFVDVITHLGPHLKGDVRFIDFWIEYLEWFQSSKHMVDRAIEKRYANDTDPLQLWCRLVSTLSGVATGHEAMQSYLQFHDKIIEEALLLEEENAWYDISSSEEASDDVPLGDAECERQEHDDNGIGQNESQDTQEARGPIVVHFQSSSRNIVVSNAACFQQLGEWVERRICLTRAGYLGMVGRNAKVDDHIAIFFGLGYLKVLHKHGDFMQNVGGVSLLDLNNEDVLGMVRTGPSEIVLC